MMMNGGYHGGGGGIPPPRLTTRGFEMNPSPHEIAIGSLEQWRRSKLSMVWKNVVVSLVKGGGGGGGGSFCIWRDAISPSGSGSFMELLQRVPLADIQYIMDENGILRISLCYSNEEPLSFRCINDPTAINQWTTTLRTVQNHGGGGASVGGGGGQRGRQQQQHSYGAPAATRPTAAAPKPAAPAAPAVDLLSHDVSHCGSTPDLLSGNHGHSQAPVQQARPVHYQTYPSGTTGGGFPQAQPNNMMFGGQPQQQRNQFGQPAAYPHQQQQQQHPSMMQRPTTGYPQQQATANNISPTNATSYPFSQPPPLPGLNQRSVQQMASNSRARSISPVPMFRHQNNHNMMNNNMSNNMNPMHSMAGPPPIQKPQPQQQRSTTPTKSKVNQGPQVPKAQPLQPAHMSIPRPNVSARKQAPRRSLSAPMSPIRPKTTTQPQAQQQQQPVSYEELKKHVITTWALDPPRNIKLKPLIELIRTLPMALPPRMKMIVNHPYFTEKWQPITAGEYHQEGGLKKCLRKVRVFLHPDKLPNDFTPDQILLCKLLWDIINDAQQHQHPEL